MEVFNEYLAAIADEEQRARMKEIFEWIFKGFPSLKPRIAWNQPMFTDHGTFIISFSPLKHHLSVAPEAQTMELFSAEIAASGYSQSTNIFRIKWSEPVDFSLLERMIRYNIRDKADCSSFWRK